MHKFTFSVWQEQEIKKKWPNEVFLRRRIVFGGLYVGLERSKKPIYWNMCRSRSSSSKAMAFSTKSMRPCCLLRALAT